VPVWQHEVPTHGTVDLPPDPRALDALGRNHSLETALADLVDNSIDADATRVLIRFVRRNARLVCLYVADNGRGIRPEDIDASMTVGGRRDYSHRDLGHFGLGLKAASFSQASSLTVLSRATNDQPVGRRWLLDPARTGYQCDVVPAEFAAAELDRGWPFPLTVSGTVIRWDRVRGFPSTDDADQVEEYLDRTISHLGGHLGLMFHRILTGRDLHITVDVEDIAEGVGVPVLVGPLDPFDYPHTPEGWPKDLIGQADGITVTLQCHIWPGKSSLPQFRLPGGAEHRQGLYFYRRDRLLQAGGWEGVHAADKKLQLARVALDIGDHMSDLFRMNSEKSRVTAGPTFSRAASEARASDGTSILDYLRAAEAIWVTANQRLTARRKAVLPPGRGFHPRTAREIRDELPLISGYPLHILWRPFRDDRFLEVDRPNRTLWLNQDYRRALLAGRRGGLNDLPLMKSLLFLLVGNVFEDSHLGPRDKDNIELWQSILTTAAKAERSSFEARS
jgi:hypothetical protein